MTTKAKIFLLGTFLIFPASGYVTVILLWLVGRTGPASLTKNAWQVLLMCTIYGLFSLPLVLKILDQRVRTVLTLMGTLFTIEFTLNFTARVSGRSEDLSFAFVSALFNGIDGLIIGAIAGMAVTAVYERLQQRPSTT
jgi:hypothetical protein